MIARHLDDGAQGRRRRDAEPIAGALHHEGRHRDRVELGQPALRRRRAPGRQEREGEAQHADGPGRFCCAARDPRAERAAADYERQALQPSSTEVGDDGGPGGVELVRRCRAAAPCHAVGLFHERNAEPLRDGRVRRSHQVGSADPSARSVAEDERGARSVGAA